MANMRMDKNPMPEQDPKTRIGNFDETALGYTAEAAVDEAQRCLNCREPRCVEGCPMSVPIPAFIAKVAEGDFKSAYDTLFAVSNLPAVCGRVCPQEALCEGRCIRGIKGERVAIGRLERFTADWHIQNGGASPDDEYAEPNGHRVAVIGSGPAGLTCAGELVRLGYEVTVYEAMDRPGGLMMFGIPAFRLPRSVVEMEIVRLESLGVEIITESTVGKMDSVDELFEQGFEAVFIGSGAGRAQKLGVPGEDLPGVLSARDLLMRAEELGRDAMAGKRVVVAGDGDMAVDAARTALRLGAEDVRVLCGCPVEALSARREEVHRALAEGVAFLPETTVTEILAGENGRAAAVRTVGSGGDQLEADTVVVAVGAGPDPLLLHTTPGLDSTASGGIAADAATGATSRVGVFAGGDAVTGAGTVISAMMAGKSAAASIHKYIQEK